MPATAQTHRRREWSVRLAATGLALLALAAVPLVLLNGAAPLPVPSPLDVPLPPSSPPPDLRLFRIETGVTHRSALFAYRGGSWADKRDFALDAVLVRHPRGDLLIDAGLGRRGDEHLAEMPWLFRAMTRLEKGRPAAQQLSDAGVSLANLRVLLTHAHWDHASGLSDLGDVRVLVTAEERRFVDEGGFLSAAARDATGARWELYTFEGGAYLGYASHHDVFGDGSVVVVPAPGHTPGSVIVFVSTPQQRYAFVGDLAWQLEGILEREERPWPTRAFGDTNAEQVRVELSRMDAIARRFPEIQIVPAHDARAYAGILPLPLAGSPAARPTRSP
jgi:glyoxylase-like metal-dependent hydrolase (beta-lactamase superfamily II)